MNDLPNTPENIKKKSIVGYLGIKYERSFESGHIYHDKEGYFKQVKLVKRCYNVKDKLEHL